MPVVMSKYLFFCVVFILCIACKSNFYLSRRENKILKKYGEISNVKDTIISKNKFQLTYKEGVLLSIGKLDNNSKTGVWWYFTKNHVVKYILDYKKDKIDTLCEPTINEAW
jgi:hypothetical protein